MDKLIIECETRAKRLTFHVQNHSAVCKTYESAGKIVNYNFWSIARNNTRLPF
jgi:hypothetical protein